MEILALLSKVRSAFPRMFTV